MTHKVSDLMLLGIVIRAFRLQRGISQENLAELAALHRTYIGSVLAERVSDDIPASRIMMAEKFLSILSTLDVKSFPPPHGDLVNRGELGSPTNPSDKRRYVEEHSDFSACFSYNTRTIPSPPITRSGKRIYVVDLNDNPDVFAQFVLETTS